MDDLRFGRSGGCEWNIDKLRLQVKGGIMMIRFSSEPCVEKKGA
jgi:hypothetical protein